MRLLRPALHALGFCAILSAAAFAEDGTRPGFWAILTRANVWLQSQVISTNATISAEPITPGTAPVFTLIGPDSTNAVARVVSINGTPNVSGIRYGGTGVVPAAVASGSVLSFFGAQGYNGTALGPANAFRFTAAEAFTTAAAGARAQVLITPIGTSAVATGMTIGSDGIAMAYPTRVTSADGVSGAGTDLGSAKPLMSDVNFVTCASGAGVSLSAYNSTLGGVQPQQVFNDGTNACNVFPASTSATIKAGTTTGAPGAAIALGAGGHGTFYARGATVYTAGP